MLRPVMIPFKTDWKVVLAGSEKGGSFLICDSRQSAQEVGLPEFRRLWSASSNIGLRAKGLKREVVSRLDWTVLVPQHQLLPPESLRDRFDRLPEPDGMEDAMKRYAHLNPKEFPIPVTEENLRIIGKMLGAIQPGSWYWDRIVEGGLPGYDVYIHEMVRAGWCFEQIPPIDPCSIKEAGRIYEIEHPLSLMAEHRFLQSLVANRVWQITRGGGKQDFTIKELVLANPLTEHPQIDWNDIVKFDLEFGRAFLRDEDFDDRPGKVEAARRWFRDMGYRW